MRDQPSAPVWATTLGCRIPPSTGQPSRRPRTSANTSGMALTPSFSQGNVALPLSLIPAGAAGCGRPWGAHRATLNKSLAARSSLLWAVCGVATPRHSWAMAVVCALQPIPNQGAHTGGDLFSVALGMRADQGGRRVTLRRHLSCHGQCLCVIECGGYQGGSGVGIA